MSPPESSDTIGMTIEIVLGETEPPSKYDVKISASVMGLSVSSTPSDHLVAGIMLLSVVSLALPHHATRSGSDRSI